MTSNVNTLSVQIGPTPPTPNGARVLGLAAVKLFVGLEVVSRMGRIALSLGQPGVMRAALADTVRTLKSDRPGAAANLQSAMLKGCEY